MARNIHSRIQLRGTLVTQSPLHVGGYGDDVDTDLPLARDGAGQLYVPGTSLAGSFRELAERLFGNSVIEELWGFQDGDKGHASFVMVDDALVEHSETAVVEIRDHVGIDREYGAAAEHIKFDRAILPRGTRLQLRLTAEVANHEKRNLALAMMVVLKQALEAGEVRLGAAKTRGLGHVRLGDGGQLTEQCFASRQGILASLRQTNVAVIPQTDIDAAKQAHPPQKRPRLIIKIHWNPRGPLMVKAGADGIAAGMLPLVSRIDEYVSLVLPGSSVKGAFRSQAERIIRTVRGDTSPTWFNDDGKKKFLNALDVPLINELFGRRGEKATEDDKKAWLPGLSALDVWDCYGAHRLTVEQWQAIQIATKDCQLRRALADAGLQIRQNVQNATPQEMWSQAYHVAIDRWLGSAAESMLYTVLEPHCAEWEPLTLEINLQRVPSHLQLPGVALLLLVIRDLANNRLPLGFATHRGMGELQVTHLEIQGHDLDEPFASFPGVRLQNGKLTNLPPDLNSAWQQWIRQNQEVPA